MERREGSCAVRSAALISLMWLNPDSLYGTRSAESLFATLLVRLE